MAARRTDAGSALVLTILITLALGAAAVLAVVPVAQGAAAHGAGLDACAQTGREVTVTVSVGGQRVTARATDGP